MCKHHNKKPDEDCEFTLLKMAKRMVVPGILGCLIGCYFGLDWLFLCGTAGALLGAIEYCDRFDD